MSEHTKTRPHRSVSQYNQYKRCPLSYRLSRIDKRWEKPAAWLPQGSAVHTVAETIEKRKHAGSPMSLEEAHELFRDEYSKEIDRYTSETPNFEYWFRSGPYGGEADVERRFLIGMGQVETFYRFSEQQVIWISPDGVPGIELSFDIDLDGVLVRGFIDAVVRDGDTIALRDYKTGNKPGDDFQLGVYKVALEEQYGVTTDTGDYWMARTGKPTYPYDLSEWTRERVTAEFAELEANIQAGRFEPDPEPSKCLFCGVASSCEFRAV